MAMMIAVKIPARDMSRTFFSIFIFQFLLLLFSCEIQCNIVTTCIIPCQRARVKLFSCIFQFFHFTDFFSRYSVPCIFSSYTQKKFFSASLLLPAWFQPLCPTCPSFTDTTCCIFRVRSWRTSCYVGIHMFSTRNYQLIPKSWISCG